MILEQSQVEELQQLVNEWLKQNGILAGAKVTIEIVPNQVIIPEETKIDYNSTGGFQGLIRTITVDLNYQPNCRGYNAHLLFPHSEPRQGPFLFTKPMTQEDGERLQRAGDPTATVIRRILEINGIVHVNLPSGYIVSVQKEESASWGSIDPQVVAVLKDVLFHGEEVFVDSTRRKRGRQS